MAEFPLSFFQVMASRCCCYGCQNCCEESESGVSFYTISWAENLRSTSWLQIAIGQAADDVMLVLYNCGYTCFDWRLVSRFVQHVGRVVMIGAPGHVDVL